MNVITFVPTSEPKDVVFSRQLSAGSSPISTDYLLFLFLPINNFGIFGCFWVVQLWLLFSNLASKNLIEHIVGINVFPYLSVHEFRG